MIVKVQIRTYFQRITIIIADRECPELPSLEFGEVLISGREFGANAVYSCPMSYNVIGVSFNVLFNF